MPKVIYEKKQDIAYITLNRPEVMNVMDFETVELIHNIWEDFKDDNNLRVAIMTGAGGNFCAGSDISEMAKSLNDIQFDYTKSHCHGPINYNPLQHKLHKPFITAVDGNVNGGGLLFVLLSDIRIATKEASFGMGEVRINFPVEFSGILPRFIPFGLASEMLLTGRSVSAQRFYELGIVNTLVDRTELMNEAEKAAKQVCHGGPLSITAMKKLLHDGFDMDYESVVKYEDAVVSPVVNSEDTKEAITAFVEKRKPSWKGK